MQKYFSYGRIYLLVICCGSPLIYADVFHCVDSTGQKIFSDRPCVETDMGTGRIGEYDGGSVEVKNMPIVMSEAAADKIRYQIPPAVAKAKYCAKYNEVDRNRLISLRQIVPGMYLSDVVKVWGPPLSSDGPTVVFQDNEDRVTVSLIEGCVINIQRNIEDEIYEDDENYSEDETVYIN